MFLLIHLIGAMATGMMILLSLVSLMQKRTETYKRHALSLAVCGGFQLLSGAVLTAVSLQTGSGTLFCVRLGLYLSAIVLMEYWLYRRSTEELRREFPVWDVSTLLTAGTVASLTSFLFF